MVNLEELELTPQFWRDYVKTRRRSLKRRNLATGAKWDKMAEHYRTFEDDVEFRAEQELILTRMREFGMLVPEYSLLDLACGPGTHCFHLAGLCRQVTALDVSEKMIAEVRRKQRERKVANLEIEQADFFAYRPEKRFDTVFVSMSPILNELESIDRLLELSRRYLALIYWAGVRDNPLFQRCYQAIYAEEYRWDALDITIIFNYLNALGYSPALSYLHPFWRRCDTLERTVEHIVWHLEFYRDLTPEERDRVAGLVAEEADASGRVTYYTRVRKGILLLDLEAGRAGGSG